MLDIRINVSKEGLMIVYIVLQNVKALNIFQVTLQF